MIFYHHHRSKGNEHLRIQKPWVALTSICHNKAYFHLSNQNRCYFISSKNASRNIPCRFSSWNNTSHLYLFFFSTLRLNLGPQANYANTWCWAISPGFILFQTLFWDRDVHRFFTGWSWTHSVTQAVKIYYPPASPTLTLGITDVYHQAWLPSCFPERFLLTILYCSSNHVCHHRYLWPQWMALIRIEGAVYILGSFDLERERENHFSFSLWQVMQPSESRYPMWYLCETT